MSCDLDRPLLRLTRQSYFLGRDACNGVLVFGGIGQGKTTGTGQALAGAYLRAGMGGLVLCAKPEEVELWLSYARKHGRSSSVILFDGERYAINFLDYLMAREGMRAIPNAIECLLRIVAMADVATGNVGAPSESFWSDSLREVLQHALPLLYCAYGTLSVATIIDFVVSAGTKPEQYVDAQWIGSSFAAQTLRRAVDRPSVPVPEAELKTYAAYWVRQWPAIPDKTRGSVQATVTSKLGRFRHGRLRKGFTEHTTFVPEMALHGGIILCAAPALTWLDDGIIAQQLIKYLFQKCVEGRNALDSRQRERLTFLYADEAQYFIAEADEPFLSTCRGSRCCVVYLTQNLPALHARLGANKADAVEALVGKFGNIVFHGNPCNKTNTYAANLIGRALQLRANQSRSEGRSYSRGLNEGTSDGSSRSSGYSSGPGGGGSNSNAGSNSGNNFGANIGKSRNDNTSYGMSEAMDFIVEPRVFATELRGGGPQHGNRVTALWVKAGGAFTDGFAGCPNVLLTTFRQ